jgi:hypothetical protein
MVPDHRIHGGIEQIVDVGKFLKVRNLRLGQLEQNTSP